MGQQENMVDRARERKSERNEIRGKYDKSLQICKIAFHDHCKKSKRKSGIICSKDYFSYRMPCMRMVTLIDKVCSRLSFTG